MKSALKNNNVSSVVSTTTPVPSIPQMKRISRFGATEVIPQLPPMPPMPPIPQAKRMSRIGKAGIQVVPSIPPIPPMPHAKRMSRKSIMIPSKNRRYTTALSPVLSSPSTTSSSSNSPPLTPPTPSFQDIEPRLRKLENLSNTPDEPHVTVQVVIHNEHSDLVTEHERLIPEVVERPKRKSLMPLGWKPRAPVSVPQVKKDTKLYVPLPAESTVPPKPRRRMSLRHSLAIFSSPSQTKSEDIPPVPHLPGRREAVRERRKTMALEKAKSVEDVARAKKVKRQAWGNNWNDDEMQQVYMALRDIN